MTSWVGFLTCLLLYDKEEFARIKVRGRTERFVRIPMCCSSLVSAVLIWVLRAVVEAVKGLYHNGDFRRPEDLLLRQHDLAHRPNDIIKLPGASVSPSMSSPKSGTTTETAWLFRVPAQGCTRIPLVLRKPTKAFTPTDRAKGTLKQLATEQGWPRVVPKWRRRPAALCPDRCWPAAIACCMTLTIDELMQGN